MKAKPNTSTLDQFVAKHYGLKGTTKRDEFEHGYDNFKIGILLQEARKKAGLTQDELAQKSGTTKSYISKIENNIKEVRLSTLQKIVELGLGGKVELSINLDAN
jgi:DNA-binding XRE family transcriptional regulator